LVYFFFRYSLAMQTRLALNSQSSYLSLQCAGLTDMHHHTWLPVLS
jgi:hypothetical protein